MLIRGWKLRTCTTWEKCKWGSPSPLLVSHLSSATCTTLQPVCIRGNNDNSRNGALFLSSSQAVYLARKVSEANERAQCRLGHALVPCVCAHMHAHTYTRIAAQHGGFLVTKGTCLRKDAVHPHITLPGYFMPTPGCSKSGSWREESKILHRQSQSGGKGSVFLPFLSNSKRGDSHSIKPDSEVSFRAHLNPLFATCYVQTLRRSFFLLFLQSHCCPVKPTFTVHTSLPWR